MSRQSTIISTSTTGQANEFGFGPIVELASGKFLLTLNPLFGKQIGTFADQEGLGFGYGWRGEYDLTKRWGLGVEMFGEIEDRQMPARSMTRCTASVRRCRSISAATTMKPKGGDEDGGKAKAGDDDDNGKASGPAPTALSMNVGVQFGLTDATSDTALKFQGSLSF